MMKMRYKGYALMLALVLTGILLAGCGKDDDEKAPEGADINNAAQAAAAEDEDMSEDDAEDDAEGEEDFAEDEEYSDEEDPAEDEDMSEDEEWTDYDDFVQEQSQKYDFKDFDEIISSLKSGQGYAYIRLQGLDEDLLAVSESLSGTDGSADEASIYRMEDGICSFMSSVGGYGPEFPLRADDGLLYAGDDKCYETYFVSEEYGSLMMKDSIEEDEEDGKTLYFGFVRETNDFDNDKEYTGGAEEFKKLIADRDKKSVIKFTQVK